MCTAGMTKSASVTRRHDIILGGPIIATTSKQILGALSERVRSTVPARAVKTVLLAVTECKTRTSHSELYEEQQKHNDHVLMHS